MRKYIWPSIKLTVVLIVLLVGIYPLIILGVAKLVPGRGKGISIQRNGKTIGYENIAQKFTRPGYFWPRPSSVNYNAAGSGGSNKSPYNPNYVKSTKALLDSFLEYNPDIKKEDVPSEMITASASGLDPDITVQGAEVQVPRVATARNISRDKIGALVKSQTEKPWLGIFGIERINVLKLNLALDKLK